MNIIFNMDNAFYRAIAKMVDLVWLNILTVICSIPIVTMGASMTALYYVGLRMVKNEEGSITKNFFCAFRDNFKKSTGIWLLALAVLCFYTLDMNILKQGIMDGYGSFKTIVMVVVSAIILFIYLMLCYIFPLLARYENTIKQTIKNAMLLLFAFFPRTLCMGIMYLFPIALMLLSDYFIFFWFLWGLSFPAYMCCVLMVRIFEKIEGASVKEEQVVE